MFVAQSRSWNDIVVFYRELKDVYGWDMQPMILLVEKITSSSYADGIYPITSHSTLCISQNSQVDFERNLLLIDFVNVRFKFKYRESLFVKKDWIKECDADSGFATFEQIMKTLKWFS